ncbi:M15 family metallopeptidase [Alteromonas sp. a30]|uniref:M15 family metallopeptidase n=1 Tax=Alteromonas sp. a30 TaxID=2730917 RepID=UPI0022817E0E|nr:M15 family metallopeptidase [Alteromonas sp. a30]MCY7297483.1 M15 family metallopeptidase [Alteromonas sp. a30]
MKQPHFQLSQTSQTRLQGVHPDLINVVEQALRATKIDFMVGEGIRSFARQKELVQNKKSHTLKSRHLTGHAVDLWLLPNNKITWDAAAYCTLANTMKQAAEELNIPLQWGGVWDRKLSDLSDDMEKETELYRQRRAQQGKTAFFDGPHFQLPWSDYPQEQSA